MMGRFLMLRPDRWRMGCVTSDVNRGRGVTQSVRVGHIAIVIFKFKNIQHIPNTRTISY